MSTHTIKSGDTYTIRESLVSYSNGQMVPIPQTATCFFLFREPGSLPTTSVGTVIDAAVGDIAYTFTENQTALMAGDVDRFYAFEFRIVDTFYQLTAPVRNTGWVCIKAALDT